MNIILIPLMILLTRQSGSGYFKHILSGRIPELFFALIIALVSYSIYGVWWLGVLSFISSYLAMEAGHGTFYAMTGWKESIDEDTGKTRMQTLDYPLHFIYKLLKLDVTKSHYSWVGMSLKGLWIGLPLGLWALVLSPLWAISYYIGHRLEENHAVAEYLSGLSIGCIMVLVLS